MNLQTFQEVPILYREDNLESITSSMQSWDFPFGETFQVNLQQALPVNLPEEYAVIQHQIPALETFLQDVLNRLEEARALATKDDAIGRICNAKLSIRNLCAPTEMALRSLGSGDNAAIDRNAETLQMCYQDTLRTLNETQHRELQQVMHNVSPEVREILRYLTSGGQDASTSSRTPQEVTNLLDGATAPAQTAEGERNLYCSINSRRDISRHY